MYFFQSKKVQENGEDLLADKFAWFSRDRPKPTPKPSQRPVQIMSRSGFFLLKISLNNSNQNT